MSWLEDPNVRLLLWTSGGALVILGALFFGLHQAWASVDPKYRGIRRRPSRRRMEPWMVEPKPRWVPDPSPLVSTVTDPDGEGEHSWPVHPSALKEVAVPVKRPEPPRPEETGSWTMPPPADGGPRSHRAVGSRQDDTRKLHPGYAMGARARVVPEEDTTDPVLD